MFVNKYFITWQELSFLIDHIGYAVCLLRCLSCSYFEVNKFENRDYGNIFDFSPLNFESKCDCLRQYAPCEPIINWFCIVYLDATFDHSAVCPICKYIMKTSMTSTTKRKPLSLYTLKLLFEIPLIINYCIIFLAIGLPIS